MLTYKNTGIQKYILDWICEIDDEIVNEDPEYRKLGERVDEWKKQLAAKLPPEDKKMLRIKKKAGSPKFAARKRPLFRPKINQQSQELLPLRRKAGAASLHGRKTAVAVGSLN